MKRIQIKQRNDTMRKLRHEEMWTLRDIGEKFGISRQRVFQIVERSGFYAQSQRNKAISEFVISATDLTNEEVSSIIGLSECRVSARREGTRHAIKGDGTVKIGIDIENEYARKLEDMGMLVELQPHGHKFDALVNGHRVDFKYCGSQKRSPSTYTINPKWRFHVKKWKRQDCDIYFCVTAMSDVFIIPSVVIPENMEQLVFNFPAGRTSKGKWQSYKDRYDLLW